MVELSARITDRDCRRFAVQGVPSFCLRARHVVLVIPTASYLAYGDEHQAPGGAFAQSIFGQTPVLGASDLYLHERPELGLSLYDLHSDGSGVHLSSLRRPIVNLRPDKRTPLGGPWRVPAGLHLVDWLTEKATNSTS
ncbi:hypothetical protein EEB14_54700 [Rhodococcus sp. WS4]|nr:hypothetical protein EEB14_54700 [Rhodococcus sp. WS4]